ncbi:MAG: 3-phosphoserine/phosphohydroxythreonine transaminase [Oscillospiraceae bacterium]|nr:3-phosphoserine/phosphohydroxythreonine transaminase [Oscillospiraceae bacterium]
MQRVFNFSPGPSMLPLEVLRRAAAELENYNNTGMSVMEMSHRSKDYLKVYEEAEAKLCRVMGIPDTHKALFLQGGATLQFASIPMNLMGSHKSADYAVTGFFSNKAYVEGKKYGGARIALSTKDSDYTIIPLQSAYSVDTDAAYFHYCHNNTVFGTRWPYTPDTGKVPLVCDMSSSILSEPVDVSKFGIIYAGAQKNMGPAGLTVVIIRRDLTGNAMPLTPSVMDYAAQTQNDSMINTPATYGIYLLSLVLDWVEKQGGLAAMQKYNRRKADMLYSLIDDSNLYRASVATDSRSMMNVTFNLGNVELDKEFVTQAAKRGLVSLAGHRATGGIRASIYNAMPVEGIKTLCDFMKEFEFEYGK